MSEQHALLLQTLTSLHAGSGQPQAAIQNPLLRDPASGLPLISPSTVTGALRKALRDSLYQEYASQPDWKQAASQDPRIQQIFGTREIPGSAGLSFGPARLLALPLRSAKGIWALITSPTRLTELAQDLEQELPELPRPENMQAFCAPEHPGLLNPHALVLEDLEFSRQDHWSTGQAWLSTCLKLPTPVSQRLILVSDTSLQQIVQSKLELMAFPGQHKQTQFVEFLPAESLLWSRISPKENAVGSLQILRQNCPDLIRLGAYQSLGKGLCQVTLLTPQEGN